MNFSLKHKSYTKAAKIQDKVSAWAAGWLPKIPQLPGVPVELGAGTGLFTHHLANKFPDLLATDLSQNMLEEGRRNCPKAKWEVLNAWELPENRNYGSLFSSSLMQWCENPSETFQQWFRCLAPGGWMLHSFFVEGTLQELKELEPECIAVNFRPAEEWKTCLESAGFRHVVIETREDFQSYPNALGFFRNLHDIGATSPGKIPPARLRQIIESYDRAYGRNGRVPATWVTARILCKR